MKVDFSEFPYLKPRALGMNIPKIKYMGGKGYYARGLLEAMTNKCPEADTFIDLFGGGGSMSFYAMCVFGLKAHYNEINPKTYAILDALMSSRFNRDNLPSKMLWNKFDRDLYKETKKFVNGYFSLDANEYLRMPDSEKIEFQNALMHLNVYGFNSLFQYLMSIENQNQFQGFIDRVSREWDVNYYEWYLECQRQDDVKLPPIVSMRGMDNVVWYKENYKNFTRSNLDYREAFKMLEGRLTKRKTIIYCDVEYKDTEGYDEKLRSANSFNHAEFAEWLLEMRDKGWEVFISEAKNDYLPYTREIYAVEKKKNSVMKSSNSNKNGRKDNPISHERLYTNM